MWKAPSHWWRTMFRYSFPLFIILKHYLGSIFDFAVYLFHNHSIRTKRNLGGVFYYLPKLEAYQEARLWNEVFLTAQRYLGLSIGHIRWLKLFSVVYFLCHHLISKKKEGKKKEGLRGEGKEILNFYMWQYQFNLFYFY